MAEQQQQQGQKKEKEKDEVILLGPALSPFVARVRMALELNAIPYQLREEDLANKSELLLQSNPVYKKVPVLIHNGRPICESLLIIQYIEEQWPSCPHPLLPSDPYQRAQARFWVSFIDNSIVTDSMRGVLSTPDKQEQAVPIQEMMEKLQHLEKELKARPGPYFGGNTVDLVDVALGCMRGMGGACKILSGHKLVNEVSTPTLRAWFDRFSATPVVGNLVPESAGTAEFFRKKYGHP